MPIVLAVTNFAVSETIFILFTKVIQLSTLMVK